MKVEEHKKEVEKLKTIESELINLIEETNNTQLMNKFIQWKGQRNICNEGFNDILLNL